MPITCSICGKAKNLPAIVNLWAQCPKCHKMYCDKCRKELNNNCCEVDLNNNTIH